MDSSGDRDNQSGRSRSGNLDTQSDRDGNRYGNAELNPEHDAHRDTPELNPDHEAHRDVDADAARRPNAFPDGQPQPNTCTESDIERSFIATGLGGMRLGARRDDARRA